MMSEQNLSAWARGHMAKGEAKGELKGVRKAAMKCFSF
jgi:hypothetical protein